MTLQARLKAAMAAGPAQADRPALTDPVAYLRTLASGSRFHRDSGFGRIYHPGGISLRENSPTDSLHIVIHGDHISAHVDRVSPLGARPDAPTRYSFRRAAAHNVVGAAQDVIRLLRGRKGDHRSHLDCAWMWEDDGTTSDLGTLVHPAAWSVHLEARVEGTLDEGRLRKAFEAVLTRPAEHEFLDMVECPDDRALDGARAGVLAAPVTMTEWPPLRARLARRPGGDTLLLNVNHGASDGFSAVRLLEAMAEAYREGTGPALDFLAVNDLPVRPTSASVSALAGWWRHGVELLRDWLARPVRLAADGGGGDDDEPGYGFHLVELSVADTRRVANVHRQGTARNVLLAGLHLAIEEWNRAHGGPSRQVGVLVPVDLRPPEWQPELVGNFCVTARISTGRRHRTGARAALKAITAQKVRNKRFRTGVALLAALERTGLLPLWAKQSLVVLQPLTRNREVDTAMLANAGWLDPAPSFGPEAGTTTGLWFSLPARSPQSLCIGAVTVAGRLHLTFRYPHRLFDAGAAKRFAELFVDHAVSVAERRW